VTYLLADHLGSTVGTVSDAGVTEHMQYYPFGSVRAGHVSTDRGFTGQRREGGSRLGAYFYNARFYATGLGHFMSADTVSTDGLDRYAYAGFNPMRYSDPSGHVWTSDGGGSCDTICEWQAAWAAFHPEQAARGGSGGCDDLCRCASDVAACSALAGAAAPAATSPKPYTDFCPGAEYQHPCPPPGCNLDPNTPCPDVGKGFDPIGSALHLSEKTLVVAVHVLNPMGECQKMILSTVVVGSATAATSSTIILAGVGGTIVGAPIEPVAAPVAAVVVSEGVAVGIAGTIATAGTGYTAYTVCAGGD
jgi:RHS repeat-associated protein